MITTFFHMGGYEYYIFSAYGCVISLLIAQWFIPWKRWQTFLRKQKNKS